MRTNLIKFLHKSFPFGFKFIIAFLCQNVEIFIFVLDDFFIYKTLKISIIES